MTLITKKGKREGKGPSFRHHARFVVFATKVGEGLQLCFYSFKSFERVERSGKRRRKTTHMYFNTHIQAHTHTYI